MEKQINTVLFFYGMAILIIAASCSTIGGRTGYKKVKSDTADYYCHVSFWRLVDFDDTSAVRIGSAKYKGTTFRTHCSEMDAMDELQNEACSIGANVIVVVSDKRPDFLHGCYRCTAYFYRSKSIKYRSSSAYYSSENLRKRMQRDKGVSAEPNISIQPVKRNY